MKIHLIAMGGAVMHNLALALQENGHAVTGSDDEIYNPAKDRLAEAGLLPPVFGWFSEKITPDLDFAILGMHAKADNPELLHALELGVKVYSFPEFIHQHALHKKRVVVAGSHGKTTTTAAIMHVLQRSGIDFDYLVGAQLEGFKTMVRLSDAPIMVIEGDEYLSSPIDRRPKFLHYKPHIAILTGVAWDHINVFPDYEDYKRQFGLLLEHLAPGADLIFYQPDKDLAELVGKSQGDFFAVPYHVFPHKIIDHKAWVNHSRSDLAVELQVFGPHNLANLAAAQLACLKLGIPSGQFWRNIKSFKGAAKRLQNLVDQDNFAAWLDFAHAPSKAKATVEAVKSLYPDRPLVACLELHTFSSLNKDFLPLYAGTLDLAESACIFYSPHTLAMKNMPPISAEEIRAAFGLERLEVITEPAEFEAFLQKQDWAGKNLLLMSSGTFGGLELKTLAERLPVQETGD